MKSLFKSLTIIFLVFCFCQSVGARQIYKCIEQGGTISYQERPCVDLAETMLTKRGIVDDETYSKSLKSLSGSLGENQVTMLAFDWWRGFRKEIDDRFLHFKFTDDEGDTPITLLVDFIVPASEQALLDKEIKSFFTQKAEKFLKTSVETKLIAQKMKANQGFGYYQTFTDKNLVGKSSYPAGEYLYTTSGLMTHGDVMVNFTLLSNDYLAQNHLFAMGFLENGIKIEKNSSQSTDKSNLSYLEQATVALLEQKIVDSVELFRQATLEEPDNFQAWFGYCISLREVNRLQSAFIACDRAKLVDPNNETVSYEVWNLLIKARLFEPAFELGKKLFDKNPSAEHTEAMINLGYFAMHDKEFDVAESAFGFLVNNGAESTKLTHDRAMLAHAQGNNTQAVEIVNELKGMGSDSDEYVNLFINAIESGGSLFSVYENEESYTLIPKKLHQIGTGEIADLEVEPWVTQRFPVNGVGLLEVETPEHWIAKGEIDVQDGNHVLSLKVFDPKVMTKMIVIDLGKVASDWSLEDAKNQMKTTLNVFFSEDMPAFKTLTGGQQGFELDHLIEKDSAKVRVKHKVILDGIIEYSINMTALNANAKDKAIHDRVFNGVKLIASDQTPLFLSEDIEPLANQVSNNSAKVKEYNPGVELPKPPSEYSWHKMNDIMAIFLKPAGWHTNTDKSKDEIIHVISKQPASKGVDFEIGLSVIGSKNLLNKLDMSISQYALAMAQLIEESDENTLIGIQDKSNNAFKTYIIRYENHPKDKLPIKVHQIISGNNKTSSVYMILFEAPKAEWEESWKIGEVILKSYLLDDEF